MEASVTITLVGYFDGLEAWFRWCMGARMSWQDTNTMRRERVSWIASLRSSNPSDR